MLNPDRVEAAIELQDKSYRLLKWVNSRLRGDTLGFDVAHEAMSAADKRRAAEEKRAHEPVEEEAMDDRELKILARDRKNNPLLSRLDWSEKAIERVLRVAAGKTPTAVSTKIE